MQEFMPEWKKTMDEWFMIWQNEQRPPGEQHMHTIGIIPIGNTYRIPAPFNYIVFWLARYKNIWKMTTVIDNMSISLELCTNNVLLKVRPSSWVKTRRYNFHLPNQFNNVGEELITDQELYNYIVNCDIIIPHPQYPTVDRYTIYREQVEMISEY